MGGGNHTQKPYGKPSARTSGPRPASGHGSRSMHPPRSLHVNQNIIASAAPRNRRACSPHPRHHTPTPNRDIRSPLRPAPIPLRRHRPSIRSSLACARRMQLPHPTPIAPIAHPSFVWMPCRLRERRCSRRWEEERCNIRSTFETSKYNVATYG